MLSLHNPMPFAEKRNTATLFAVDGTSSLTHPFMQD
jgi:hypothetical protein